MSVRSRWAILALVTFAHALGALTALAVAPLAPFLLESFTPRERGIAMGVKQTGLTLGGLTGALLLPPIARGWSWRHALATAGLLSLFSALLVAIFYRSQATHPTASPVERPRLSELG